MNDKPAQELLGKTLLPLRAFLGFTFCFAGLQKLANPDFLSASSPVSIQAQLAGAARRSPIHALISPLTHVAVPLGLLIAFGELAIGIGTLLGLWARLAALGGLLMSFMLFLTVSYHSSPYYTGSDIVFVFAWTPLLLSGAGSVLSLDAVLAERALTEARQEQQAKRQQKTPAQAWASRAKTAGKAAPRTTDVSRREVALKGMWTAAVAVGALAFGGLVAGVGRVAKGTKNSPASGTVLTPGGGTSASSSDNPSSSDSSPASSPGDSSGSGSQHPSGTAIGPASDVPVGGSASFQDPASGDPAIVLRPSSGTFLAFDAVCPHAGCTVAYDQSVKLIVCPCHGSEFNPSTGAVEQGPAPTGLKPIRIAEASDGQLYAV